GSSIRGCLPITRPIEPRQSNWQTLIPPREDAFGIEPSQAEIEIGYRDARVSQAASKKFVRRRTNSNFDNGISIMRTFIGTQIAFL
ncbi:MAG: hypothetical protein ACJ785_08390, partial [Gemmatimonadaceae bacterium]